jgi:hypothetical protein
MAEVNKVVRMLKYLHSYNLNSYDDDDNDDGDDDRV